MKKYLIALAVVVLLAVAYYGLSPLFRNTTLNEEVPVAPTPVPETEPTAQANVGTEAVAVVDTPAHPASGTARIVVDGERQYLRYENFKTINGPDLYVYLSKDTTARDIIDLGRLKATEGNINYEIPAGVRPEEYPYALVWCKAFGVLFNSAQLY